MNEDIFFINSINKNKNINSNSEYIESSFTKDLTTDYYNKFRDTYISIDNRDKNKYYSNNNCEIDFNKNFENVENIELIDINLSNSNPPVLNNTLMTESRSSFVFEKHLEDFLVSNWEKTPLSSDYKILKNDNEFGQQYRTEIGPIDILAERRDGTGFLVVELKRDRASDVVVGQILRYMGWVNEHLCTSNQSVRGCIIAQRKDQKLEYALKQVNNIEFLKYELDFRLTT